MGLADDGEREFCCKGRGVALLPLTHTRSFSTSLELVASSSCSCFWLLIRCAVLVYSFIFLQIYATDARQLLKILYTFGFVDLDSSHFHRIFVFDREY